MFSTRDVGSLAVVEQTQERKAVERELRSLDRNLFLDPEVAFDRNGEREFVWTVKEHIGSERPPHLVLEWRDAGGRPLPLTYGIIDAVRQTEGKGETIFTEISEHNERLRRERAARAEEAHEEIMRDMVPRLYDTRSAILHRGVHLRMSRDKRRARGWRV